MKLINVFYSGLALLIASCNNTQPPVDSATEQVKSVTDTPVAQTYFIDVHDLEPGKVKFDDVMGAHKKDLATQDKYGVKFLKFWVDEEKGKVYCLSQANDPEHVKNTHKEAHGLIPSAVHSVTDGEESVVSGNKQLFIDVHETGPGKVRASDVAKAHDKDLAVQSKHEVNFVNYWVDEKQGLIFCLSEAPDSAAVKETHKEAHGLVPAYVMKVKEGE